MMQKSCGLPGNFIRFFSDLLDCFPLFVFSDMDSEAQIKQDLQAEANPEERTVSYFIDGSLAGSENYVSPETDERKLLSALDFDDMLTFLTNNNYEYVSWK